MESRLNELYPFKVWIGSLLLAALLCMVAAFFIPEIDLFNIWNLGKFLFYVVSLSFLFSLPTFIVCYVYFFIFGKKIKSAVVGKTTFSLIAIVGMLITLYLIGGIEIFSLESSGFFPWIYAASILLAGFVFKFRLKQEPSLS